MECSIWYPNSKKWYIKHDKDCFIRYSNSEKWYIRHSKERFIWYPNSEKRYIRHLKDCFIRFPNSEKWYIRHGKERFIWYPNNEKRYIRHLKECFIRHDHPNSEERYIAPWQSWILDSRQWIPDSTFWIPKSPSVELGMRFFSGIPDSLRWITDSKAQGITNTHNKPSVIWYPAGTERWSNTRRLEIIQNKKLMRFAHTLVFTKCPSKSRFTLTLKRAYCVHAGSLILASRHNTFVYVWKRNKQTKLTK